MLELKRLKDLPNEQGFEFIGVTFSGCEVDCFVHQNFAGMHVVLSLYTREEMFGKLKGWKALPEQMKQPTNQQLRAALNNACLAAAFGDYEFVRANAALQELRNARTSWSSEGEDLDLLSEIDRHLDWWFSG